MTLRNRPLLRSALTAIAVVLSLWPLWNGSPACWGAVAGSWLFATGVAFGCVALSAATQLAGAGWTVELNPSFSQITGFLPWSLGTLVLLIGAGPRWLPWIAHVSPERHWWLNYPGFAVREVIAPLALAWLAWRQVRRPKAEHGGVTSVAYLFSFAVILTLWSVDFVMALDREWVDPLLGAYYFMGSLLGGVALLVLVAGRKPDDGDLRHDLGKLLFGLSVFWAYLTFVQLLVIWYGNLPEETGFVLERLRTPWLQLGLTSALLIFVLPFLGLMREPAKRNTRLLSFGAATILTGLWIELQLLVVPSLAESLDVPIISAAVGSALFFALRLAAALDSAARTDAGPDEARLKAVA